MDIVERIKKFLLSLAVFFLNSVKWLTIIFLSLVLLVLLHGFVMCYWHGNAKTVNVKFIGDKDLSLELPIRAIPEKKKSEGSELHQYQIGVRYFQGVWFLHHIPKEKRTYLTCSYMGMSASFILHYAITDPKMEKTLLDEIKQIKPRKIIK